MINANEDRRDFRKREGTGKVQSQCMASHSINSVVSITQ